jgi:hypothetical protein
MYINFTLVTRIIVYMRSETPTDKFKPWILDTLYLPPVLVAIQLSFSVSFHYFNFIMVSSACDPLQFTPPISIHYYYYYYSFFTSRINLYLLSSPSCASFVFVDSSDVFKSYEIHWLSCCQSTSLCPLSQFGLIPHVLLTGSNAIISLSFSAIDLDSFPLISLSVTVNRCVKGY